MPLRGLCRSWREPAPDDGRDDHQHSAHYDHEHSAHYLHHDDDAPRHHYEHRGGLHHDSARGDRFNHRGLHHHRWRRRWSSRRTNGPGGLGYGGYRLARLLQRRSG